MQAYAWILREDSRSRLSLCRLPPIGLLLESLLEPLSESLLGTVKSVDRSPDVGRSVDILRADNFVCFVGLQCEHEPCGCRSTARNAVSKAALLFMIIIIYPTRIVLFVLLFVSNVRL